MGVQERDATDTPYSLTPSRTTVPAGPVAFQVQNYSGDPHNLVVVAWAADPSAATESALDALTPSLAFAELTGRRAPGPPTLATQRTTLNPGTYILYCSLPGHYGQGMHAAITVG